MSKPSLAEQIGTVNELIDEAAAKAMCYRGGLEQYRYERRSAHLKATKDVLGFLINHADEFKAFVAQKQEG